VQSHRRNPTVFYIHPYEIGSMCPRLPGLSLPRRFRHYVGMTGGQKRIGKLLGAVRFTTMARVLKSTGQLASV
jgi:hypothetical protein